jgi:hypothetical protein
MRNCSLCHAPDRPELNDDAKCNCPGGDIFGHTNDCQKIEHFVQKDIRLREGALTKRLMAKGWTERGKPFKGKPAMERLICLNCIRKQDEVERVIQFQKRKAEELNPDKVHTMYQILSD